MGRLDSDERRKAIVEAAVPLFARNGFSGTTTRELAAAAGVSEALLFRHFPSKQSVFLELLKQWLEGLDREMGKAMSASASVPEGLMAMAGQMKGVFAAADGRLPLFLEFWQQARRDPAVWKELIAPYRRYRDFFATIVQAGIAEGSLRRVDAKAAGQALVALAVGFVVQGVLDPGGAKWDLVMRDALRLLIAGLSSGR